MVAPVCIASGQRLGKISEGERATMSKNGESMPPLVAFAGALGSLAAVRWAYRTARKVSQQIDEARRVRAAETYASTEIPTLRRDPDTGAYRPG